MSLEIEKSILVSILEHDFVVSDKRILEVELSAEYFTHPIHKLFINAINRLKELDEPVNSDFLRAKFIEGHKWDELSHEVQLLEIIASNPLGSLYLFESYLKVLEDEYMKRIQL